MINIHRKGLQASSSGILAADGQVEGGAEGETEGAVHAWNRPGVGYTQRHGEKVHERRESTCGAISTDAERPMI